MAKETCVYGDSDPFYGKESLQTLWDQQHAFAAFCCRFKRGLILWQNETCLCAKRDLLL